MNSGKIIIERDEEITLLRNSYEDKKAVSIFGKDYFVSNWEVATEKNWLTREKSSFKYELVQVKYAEVINRGE